MVRIKCTGTEIAAIRDDRRTARGHASFPLSREQALPALRAMLHGWSVARSLKAMVYRLYRAFGMSLERNARVRRATPPPESVVAGWYENASLLDSYSIGLRSSKQDSMRVL